MSDPNLTAQRQIKVLQDGHERLRKADVPGVDGAFTPIFVGSTVPGAFTYTTQNGFYTRLGNRVLIDVHIAISAIAVGPTGNLQIGGLPLAATTPDPGAWAIADYTGITLGAGYSQLGARVNASASLATLTKSGSAIQALFVQGGALALIGGAAEIVLSGSYRVA